MLVKILYEKEVDIKTLAVKASVGNWGCSKVNGVFDDNGDLIPCRVDDEWRPTIDIETGVIINWKKGVMADICYKVCDEVSYYLQDKNDDVVLSIVNDYVPKIMCPKENGYGDYIIMNIDENGKIQDWNPCFDEFMEQENVGNT